MQNSNLIELAKTLNDAGIPPHFEPPQARFLIQIWRQVAKGEPVAPEQIKQIAAGVEIPLDDATAFIKQAGERDKNGNVVGFVGLSQNKHAHKFQVNGYTFSTWCAWDSLFLPIMLGQTAQVESTCPTTKEIIRLNITPEKVAQYKPANAIVSIVTPQPSKSGPESVEQVWMVFCHQVHFFSNRQAASRWFSEKNLEGSFLSIEEGFELGSLAFKDILQHNEDAK
jgi:alkylmercury lyase